MDEFCKAHSGVIADLDNLKSDGIEQWRHINSIEDRLPKLVPIWVTIVLTVMGALTGSALTFAGMMLRFTGG